VFNLELDSCSLYIVSLLMCCGQNAPILSSEYKRSISFQIIGLVVISVFRRMIGHLASLKSM
jgi:hypothetical protein